MTPQDIFDTVARHILQQGKPALDTSEELDDESPHCSYRTAEGLKCAAGCLVPDEAYDPDWEGTRAGALPWFQHNFDEDSIELISVLQRAHDGPLVAGGIEDWRNRMIEIATDFQLSADALA